MRAPLLERDAPDVADAPAPDARAAAVSEPVQAPSDAPKTPAAARPSTGRYVLWGGLLLINAGVAGWMVYSLIAVFQAPDTAAAWMLQFFVSLFALVLLAVAAVATKPEAEASHADDAHAAADAAGDDASPESTATTEPPPTAADTEAPSYPAPAAADERGPDWTAPWAREDGEPQGRDRPQRSIDDLSDDELGSLWGFPKAGAASDDHPAESSADGRSAATDAAIMERATKAAQRASEKQQQKKQKEETTAEDERDDGWAPGDWPDFNYDV
ncbi:hypothetical protein [Salisaeta longa]|uniref:hypothetical protein n=1 Tax=Salisaeta longa TaxID=503170 RepID=UPI00146D3C27|nr:hypothetical protein [Salisaeta longa]